MTVSKLYLRRNGVQGFLLVRIEYACRDPNAFVTPSNKKSALNTRRIPVPRFFQPMPYGAQQDAANAGRGPPAFAHQKTNRAFLVVFWIPAQTS
jgi:hypothetical protein